MAVLNYLVSIRIGAHMHFVYRTIAVFSFIHVAAMRVDAHIVSTRDYAPDISPILRCIL